MRIAAVVIAASSVACISRVTRVEVASVDRLRVTDVYGPYVGLELAIKVRTNAPVDSTVTVMKYEIAIVSGPVIARGDELPPLAVPAGGVVSLVLPAKIDVSDLPADLPARVASGRLAYRATVWIRAETSFGRTQHRLEPAGEAPLASTFEAVVDAVFGKDAARVVDVGPFGLEGSSLAIGVELEFPGYLPFPITVTGATYDIALAGSHVGRGESAQRFVVAPRTGGRGRFDVRVPAIGVPDVAGKLLRGERELTIEGTVEIEPIGPIRRVPFRVVTTAP